MIILQEQHKKIWNIKIYFLFFPFQLISMMAWKCGGMVQPEHTSMHQHLIEERLKGFVEHLILICKMIFIHRKVLYHNFFFLCVYTFFLPFPLTLLLVIYPWSTCIVLSRVSLLLHLLLLLNLFSALSIVQFSTDTTDIESFSRVLLWCLLLFQGKMTWVGHFVSGKCKICCVFQLNFSVYLVT